MFIHFGRLPSSSLVRILVFLKMFETFSTFFIVVHFTSSIKRNDGDPNISLAAEDWCGKVNRSIKDLLSMIDAMFNVGLPLLHRKSTYFPWFENVWADRLLWISLGFFCISFRFPAHFSAVCHDRCVYVSGRMCMGHTIPRKNKIHRNTDWNWQNQQKEKEKRLR